MDKILDRGMMVAGLGGKYQKHLGLLQKHLGLLQSLNMGTSFVKILQSVDVFASSQSPMSRELSES